MIQWRSSADVCCICMPVWCISMFRVRESECRCSLHRIFLLEHQTLAVDASRADISAFIALLSTLIYNRCAHASYILRLFAVFKASGHAHRTWLRHLQHTCKWGVALMYFLFLFSFPAQLLSLALVFPFAILYSTRVALFLAFSPLKSRFFLRSMFFLVFRFLFHPKRISTTSLRDLLGS